MKNVTGFSFLLIGLLLVVLCFVMHSQLSNLASSDIEDYPLLKFVVPDASATNVGGIDPARLGHETLLRIYSIAGLGLALLIAGIVIFLIPGHPTRRTDPSREIGSEV